MCLTSLQKLLIAAAILSACSDQPPLTSPNTEMPIASSSSVAAAATTDISQVRGEVAVADYFLEQGCLSTEVIIVGSEEGRMERGDPNFTELVVVIINEFDNCTGTFTQWAGDVSSGFNNLGLHSASVSTPITLTSGDHPGETRSFTVNVVWTATGPVTPQPSHANQVIEGQRSLFHFNFNTRSANVTTAELIDANGTNLLAGASLVFAVLANTSSGTTIITYQ